MVPYFHDSIGNDRLKYGPHLSVITSKHIQMLKVTLNLKANALQICWQHAIKRFDRQFKLYALFAQLLHGFNDIYTNYIGYVLECLI